MRALAPLLALSLAAACGPAVESAYFGAPPPPRAGGELPRVYTHTRPPCAFEEIGRIKVWPRRSNLEGAVAAMRRRAGEMGGDAIVAFTEIAHAGTTTVHTLVEGVNVESSSGVSSSYSGTVVRYTDAACAAARTSAS